MNKRLIKLAALINYTYIYTTKPFLIPTKVPPTVTELREITDLRLPTTIIEHYQELTGLQHHVFEEILKITKAADFPWTPVLQPSPKRLTENFKFEKIIQQELESIKLLLNSEELQNLIRQTDPIIADLQLPPPSNNIYYDLLLNRLITMRCLTWILTSSYYNAKLGSDCVINPTILLKHLLNYAILSSEFYINLANQLTPLSPEQLHHLYLLQTRIIKKLPTLIINSWNHKPKEIALHGRITSLGIQAIQDHLMLPLFKGIYKQIKFIYPSYPISLKPNPDPLCKFDIKQLQNLINDNRLTLDLTQTIHKYPCSIQAEWFYFIWLNKHANYQIDGPTTILKLPESVILEILGFFRPPKSHPLF